MKPPGFEQYYPRPENMSDEQLRFYRWLCSELSASRFPAVDGQISFLFAYTYETLANWRKLGVEQVYKGLVALAEAYFKERKFAEYCQYWAQDCLLALGEFEEFLILSEPEEPFAADTHRSNLRCNVAYHLGRDAPTVDLLRMSGAKVTRYSREHPAEFLDLLEERLTKAAECDGPWLSRLLAAGTSEEYSHTLFQGAPIAQPKLSIPYFCFYVGIEILKGLIRETENGLRDLHGVARVGEGWVAETALYSAIRFAFPHTRVIHHGRPTWLGRQHLDIWLPHWKIAVEYHGQQHFEPVEFFGGIEGFTATQERDKRKAELCHQNGVQLLVAKQDDPIEMIVNEVERRRPWRMGTENTVG